MKISSKLQQKMNRIAFKLKRLFISHNESLITKEERYAQIIVRKLLKDPSNELLIHPFSGKRYIKAPNGSIFVVIDKNPEQITIINHKYCYVVRLNRRAADNIDDWFLQEVDKRRQNMEKEFMGNIEYSLYNIASHIGETSIIKER